MTTKPECCGNCRHFTGEDVLGLGWCALNECETTCGSQCKGYENKRKTFIKQIIMERKIGEISYLNENWIKADKSISEYPIGTKFKSINGGYWIKTERGYKWCTGVTFPRVGGDYMGLVCLPEK